MTTEPDASVSSDEPRLIGLLFVSMRTEVIAEEAAMICLKILPLICRFLDPPFTATVESFCRSSRLTGTRSFGECGFDSSAQAWSRQNWRRQKPAPPNERVQLIMCAVLLGLPIRLSPDMRSSH